MPRPQPHSANRPWAAANAPRQGSAAGPRAGVLCEKQLPQRKNWGTWGCRGCTSVTEHEHSRGRESNRLKSLQRGFWNALGGEGAQSRVSEALRKASGGFSLSVTVGRERPGHRPSVQQALQGHSEARHLGTLGLGGGGGATESSDPAKCGPPASSCGVQWGRTVRRAFRTPAPSPR